MKFLHDPKAKRNEKPIDWKQKQFTALYKDIPASQIPNGAVSEANNVLLFGEQWYARPGQDQIISFNIPDTDYTAVSKSGDLITSTDEEFSDSDLYGLFTWPDGTVDVIIAVNSTLIVQVASSTANTGTTGTLRGRLNAFHWWEKSSCVVAVFGTKIYYGEISATNISWEQAYLEKGITLTNSKSEIINFENSIYIRNESGLFRLYTLAEPYTAVKMNTESPTNTITPNTDQVSYPPTSEATILNKYGRRYIYGMAKLNGALTNNRGDGTVIIKETGANLANQANYYKDWKASWRMDYWGSGETSYNDTYIFQCDLIDPLDTTYNQILAEWYSGGSYGTGITINSETRDLILTPLESDPGTGWQGIADMFTTGLRKLYPEHEYIECVFDQDNMRLIFLGGAQDVNITAMSALATSGYTNLYGGTLQKSRQLAHGGSFPQLTTTKSIGTSSTPALQIPSGEYGWTHYSVYSTKTLGTEFPTNDNERFIWQNDVKVVSVMQVTITGSAVEIQNNLGAFSNQDVGCELHLQDTLNTLTAVTIEKVTDVDNAVLDVNTITGPSTTWAAIGVEEGGTGNIRSGTVSGVGVNETTGDYLTADDEGKTIYWDDGVIGFIRTVSTDLHRFKPTALPLTGGEHGYVIDPYGRNYNDEISDEELDNREISYICQTRFLTAFPNGQLMTSVPGFMFVSDVDETKFYYCNFNILNQYLAGHYNALYQYEVLKDDIKALVEMPNQLIIWCANSTWREQINVSETIADDRTGEALTILSGLGVVDKYIGIADKSCVSDFATGQKAVFTREPGIRLFDGYRYSENKLYDQNGNSYINTELEQFNDEVLLYYEPNLYGLMIFGNTADSSRINGSYIKSDKCWRMAVEAQQGFGFSEISGADFPFPELAGGILRVTTTYGNAITILLDMKTGVVYALSTRKLPSQESIEFSFVDKKDVEDTEITWTLGLKEHTYSDENEKLEYLEEYWYFRPYDEANKSASGHDNYGFRNAQELTSKIYIDGKETDSSQITSENPLATIFHPYELQARRIKVEMNGTASSIRGVGSRAVYKPLIRREEPPNVINERIYQRELSSDLLFWVTRGENLVLDRVSNQSPDVGDDFVKYSGPDSKATTVSEINGVDTYYKCNYTAWSNYTNTPLEYENINLGSPAYRTVALNFYVGGQNVDDDSLTLYQEGDGSYGKIVIDRVSNVYTVRYYYNNVELYSYIVTHLTWYEIIIEPDAAYLYNVSGLVDSGTFSHSVSGTQSDESVYIGTYHIVTSYIFAYIHDIRIYNKAELTEGARTYLNRDIFVRYGFSLLPPSTYVYYTICC